MAREDFNDSVLSGKIEISDHTKSNYVTGVR